MSSVVAPRPVEASHPVAPEQPTFTIVIPARNESASVGGLVRNIRALQPDAEVLVVNDGSDDETAALAADAGARVISHRYSKGNGAAIKTGARAATGQTLVFMDGDGQHRPEDISRLLERIDQGCDMVIGARDAASQASIFRHTGNWVYNRVASWMTGHRIPDLTSGFRAVNARKFREFLFMLPNGFSYPTTITMAFFRSGYTVEYIPISAPRRMGKSHLNLLRDGVKFLLIIFRVSTLYSPLKVFMPIALAMFLLATGWYGWTFAHEGRFTNMSALLYSGSVLVFLLGLISEQITALLYKGE